MSPALARLALQVGFPFDLLGFGNCKNLAMIASVGPATALCHLKKRAGNVIGRLRKWGR